MKLVRFFIMGLLVLPTALFSQDNKSGTPNIVFIISDQHKKEATGAYGDTKVITPNIDKLAKNGIVFSNAYTPAPVCAPSRAALITGMYPSANGAEYHKTPMPGKNGKTKHVGSGLFRSSGYKEGIVTLAEVFRKGEYITSSPGKMHVHGELQKNVDPDYPQGNDLGFDEISSRYYTTFPGGHYEDIVGEDEHQRYREFKKYGQFNKDNKLNHKYLPTLVKEDENNFDMVVANESVDFIERRAKDGKKFFIHVGFEKPHPPLTTTKKYLDMYNPETFELPNTAGDWFDKGKYPWVPNWVHSGVPKDLTKARNVMASYYACITEMDDMVGRVVESLKENGLYENTIIIYTTDHGEHMFEHGLRGKHNMYEASVNIPFIVSFPKKYSSNIKNESFVSFVDIMPTFCDIMGWEIPETAQGVSLKKVFEEGEILSDRSLYSEFRGGDYNGFSNVKNLPSRMLRKGDYKFIYTHGIINQLYNVTQDPDELNNLVIDETYSEVVNQLYFETIVNWVPKEYSQLKLKKKSKKLTWTAFDQANSYSVFYSEDGKVENAKIVASQLNDTNFKASSKGYYWVVADVKLSRKSKRYGEIPVYLEKYTYQLPISNRIKI